MSQFGIMISIYYLKIIKGDISEINVWDTVDVTDSTSKTDKERNKKDKDDKNEVERCSRIKWLFIINSFIYTFYLFNFNI